MQLADDFADDAALAAALPSDLDAALLLLASRCPQAARLCGGAVEVATLAQVYSLVSDRTAVDRGVERQRTEGSLLVLQLPAAMRDESLLVRTRQVEAALRTEAEAAESTESAEAAEAAWALRVGVRLVQGCPRPRVDEGRVIDAASAAPPPPPRGVTGGGGAAAAQAAAAILVRRGWLVPLRSMAVAGPGEAPAVEGTAWLWSLPRCGLLVKALLQSRSDVLRCLDRQRFGRAQQHVVERAAASGLSRGHLSLQYVLQDMEGRGLLSVDRAAPAGTSLLLSPAGVEAAGALKRKRKR